MVTFNQLVLGGGDGIFFSTHHHAADNCRTTLGSLSLHIGSFVTVQRSADLATLL